MRTALLLSGVLIVIAAGAVAIVAGSGGNGSGDIEPSGNGAPAGESNRQTQQGATPEPGPEENASEPGERSARATTSQGRRVGSGRGGVRLVQVGRFDQPVYVTGAPGFPRLLFVVEQPGRIQVLRAGRRSPRPFLNITPSVRSGGEQGLLSVAFPPDYRRSGRFYVYYTDSTGDLRIDELRRHNALRADPRTRRSVLRITHREHSNHNGGQLQFLGRQLFIATGDGGGAGDPGNNAQDRNSLLGKLLRIDPRPRGGRPYTVPRRNPYVGRAGRGEIFSIGLRNPWRFSFDLNTARRPMIAIADVGQSAQEEVNYLPVARARGANFGWNLREGFLPFTSDRTAGLTFPVFAYGRSGGCSITGGYVVTDRRLPTLYGRYLFADYCAGQLRSFAPRLRRVRSAPAVGPSVQLPTTFGEDQRGRIFITSGSGPVYMLAPPTR